MQDLPDTPFIIMFFMNAMRLFRFYLFALALLLLTGCEYGYQLDIENRFENGIYVWSAQNGLKTFESPTTVEEIHDTWNMSYIEPGQMHSFASMITGARLTPEEFVDRVFRNQDELMVAIWDAEILKEHWGVGVMADYIIQRYWLKREDILTEDGKSYKTISFPPNEGMRDVKMEPPFGTFN